MRAPVATRHILAAIGFALLYFAPDPHALGAQWQAGAASVKITPAKPVAMSGYAARTRPFERVELDIYAKALALDDGEGHRGVIVTMDLVGLSSAIAEPVCRRIAEQSGLKREQAHRGTVEAEARASAAQLRPQPRRPDAEPRAARGDRRPQTLAGHGRVHPVDAGPAG
jgi:hypothetical protein